MKLKSVFTMCLLSLALCSTQFAQTNAASSAVSELEELGKLLENYFEEFLTFSPNTATSIGDHRYDDQWVNNIGDEFRTKNRDFYARYLKELSAIDRNRLAGQDRLSYDLLKYQAETAIEGFKFNPVHLTPIHQHDDLTSTFAQMASGKSTHPFKTVKNYEDFLGRTGGFQIWVETAIANMRKGMATGIVQPRILIERKLPQIETLLVPDIKQSLFYQPINNFPKDFSEADKARLTEGYTKAITEIVYPTYRKLYDFLKNEYLPKTREKVGNSAVPGGREQYAYRVKFRTTTNLSPDEIHRIGLGEVRRIRKEMEKIKKQTGFKGDLKSFFEFLRTDSQFFPFKTADEVLDAYRAIGAKVQPNLAKYFGIFPQARLEVWRVEKFRERSAIEQYTAAPLDGSRPGIFYVGIPDATKYQTIRMEALYLHEATPGHHHQNSIQREQKNLPRFRQIGGYTAYGEGWGLYTESLGTELGLYTDPYQRLGMLAMDMMRSVRLVVDTGMHSKGWTREQAINYFLENAPMTEDDVTSQVERYIANPGQALGYKIGQLKILELRRRSERALGAKFSLRDFHDEILKDGQLPLDVLETKINEWIAKKRQNG